MTNMDKLYDSVAANGPVCVGLDTEIGYLPATDPAKTAGENVVEFNRAVIAATRGVAGCYKVQIAYYESLGLDGLRAYAETLRMARATGLPVIADIKRGDIAKTAEMYAKAHFTGDFEADIVTLAPYMGLDSISPYLPYCKEQGKGVFVLCRTSNPGSRDFEYQTLADGRTVYTMVGDALTKLGADYMGERGLLLGGAGHRRHHRRGGGRDPRPLPEHLLPDPRLRRAGRQGGRHRAVHEAGQRRRGQLQPRHPAGLQEAAGRGLRRGCLQRVCAHAGGYPE